MNSQAGQMLPGPVPPLAQRRARRQARVLGVRLRGHIEEASRSGSPASRNVRGDLRGILGGIDAALRVGLDFASPGDAELGFRRGHAVNAALVIRRNIETAVSVDAGAASRAAALARAAHFTDELIAAVEWVERRALQLEREAGAELWTATWPGRLLAVASALLPADQRHSFIEDGCGNLLSASSGGEGARYLVGLLVRLPDIAVAAWAAHRRRPRG